MQQCANRSGINVVQLQSCHCLPVLTRPALYLGLSQLYQKGLHQNTDKFSKRVCATGQTLYLRGVYARVFAPRKIFHLTSGFQFSSDQVGA